MRTHKVKVMRPFVWQGKALDIGDEIDVDAIAAAELCAMNKAEKVVVASDSAPGDGARRKKKAD